MRHRTHRGGSACAGVDPGQPVERLEPRVLFAAAAALDSSAALKALQRNAHASPELLDLYAASSASRLVVAPPGAPTLLSQSAKDTVSVTVRARHVGAVVRRLEAIGFQATASLPKLFFAEGLLPVSAIPALANLGKDLGRFGVQLNAEPITETGFVTSQGDNILEADRVRATLPGGFNGAGQRIGVISDSYDRQGGAASGIASGDLPAAGVTVIKEYSGSGGTDEGRAMLEIVHDVAPAASLAFATSEGGEAGFAASIRALADPAQGNATVIVDDIIYASEPMFQDGVVAQAIDEVVANRGVAYFTSAGNRGVQGYESTTFQTASDTITRPDGSTVTGTFYDFNPATGAADTRLRVVMPAGASLKLALQWDDPFYTASGVDTDLDLFLLNPSTGGIYFSSETDNRLLQSPQEYLGAVNNNNVSIAVEVAIRKSAGPDSGRLKMVNFGSSTVTFSEYPTNNTTVNPHAAALGAQGVAAAAYYTQDRPETFSSKGGNTFLFTPAGAPMAPQVRQAPQFAAIDGVDNTFFSSDVDGNGLPNFFGTSAAAPHAAAVAALVRQANPSFTPTQVYQRLQQTADDMTRGGAAVGFDNRTGYGLINAFDAVYPAVTPAALPFAEGFESGALSAAWETRATGAGRIQLTTANGPFVGSRHLTLDASRAIADPDGSGTNQFSLNEVTLHVNGAGPGTKTLSFRQREFGDEDQVMPTSFTGSSNTDGVALSVDGVTWYRLADLSGAASSATYAPTTVDLTAFAASFGLTLAADTRIRFQQYDDFAIESDGFAFDDVSVTTSAAPPAPLLIATVIGDGTAQRSTVKRFAFTFDRPVTLAASALKLELLNTAGSGSGSNNGAAPTDASSALGAPTSTDGGLTWAYTVAGGTSAPTGGSLADGVYRLTLDPSKVTANGVAMAGAAVTTTFHRLYGDINGSKNVNNADYIQFRGTFGKPTGDPAYVPTFDFDGGGLVNNADYIQFRNRFGKALTYA